MPIRGCQPRPLQWWHRFARQPALQSTSAPGTRPPGLPLCLPSRTGSAHLPGWPNAAPCPPSCRWDSGSLRPGSTQCDTARCSSPGPSSQTSAPPAQHSNQALLAHSSSAAADEALVSIGPHASPWEPGIAPHLGRRCTGCDGCVIPPLGLARHGAADVAGTHSRALQGGMQAVRHASRPAGVHIIALQAGHGNCMLVLHR